MKIVINVPEKVYNHFCRGCRFFDEVEEAIIAITDGAPLPKGHGDLIDRNLALSDDGLREFHMYDDYVKMRNYLKSISPIIEADKAEGSGEE